MRAPTRAAPVTIPDQEASPMAIRPLPDRVLLRRPDGGRPKHGSAPGVRPFAVP